MSFSRNIAVIEDEHLSSGYEKRYVVVDKDTGELLDDAQGYGYRSVQKAYAAFAYKTRDKSKDKEKQAKKRRIWKWMKEHKGFMDLFEEIAFDIEKGSYGAEEKINAALVKKMLKENKKLEQEIIALTYCREGA